MEAKSIAVHVGGGAVVGPDDVARFAYAAVVDGDEAAVGGDVVGAHVVVVVVADDDGVVVGAGVVVHLAPLAGCDLVPGPSAV